MGAEKNIVAIELGSSSVRAIVGQKKADGSLQELSGSSPEPCHADHPGGQGECRGEAERQILDARL